jgi:hypothetical protein
MCLPHVTKTKIAAGSYIPPLMKWVIKSTEPFLMSQKGFSDDDSK